MSTITWLHLSDLHFRADGEGVAPKQAVYAWDRDIVLKSLLEDVRERIAQDGLQPDFIIVSGDIAFSGKAEDYALAAQFFDALLKTTKLRKDRLFIVPGNHDVDRSLVSFGAQTIASSLKDHDAAERVLASDEDRQFLFRRLDGYVRFVCDYFGEWLPLDSRDYSFVRFLELERFEPRRVAVLGLNSAWLAYGGEDDARQLLLGERQVRAAVHAAQDADLRLAVVHHPFDWLREFDRYGCEPVLMSACDFILHGHLHRPGIALTQTPDIGAMVIAAGASYETRTSHNACNWVELNLTDRRGIIHLRMYSDQAGSFWTKDVVSYRNVDDGRFEFSLPEKKGGVSARPRGPQPSPPTIDVARLEVLYLQRMKAVCNDLPLTVIDPKIDPKVRERPMGLLPVYVSLDTQTMVEAEEPDQAGEKRRTPRARPDADVVLMRAGERETRRLSALEAVEGEPRLVLLGDPGSGKSTFMKYLALCLADGRLERLGVANEGLMAHLSATWTHGALLPIRVVLKEFAASARCDGTADGLWRYIEDTLTADSLGDFAGRVREELAAENAIVLLDGLDEIADPQKRTLVRQSVAEFARTYGGANRYLVTCRSYSYQQTCDRLERFVDHKLAPFAQAQIDEFIDAWHCEIRRLGWKSEREAQELTRRLQAAVRREDLAALASNPLQLTMMTLLHYSRGQLPGDRVKLYKEMVELLLSRWDEARLVAISDVVKAVKMDDLETGLRRAAYLVHRLQTASDAPADVEEALLRTVLKDYLQGSWDRAGELLAHIEDRAGLLIETGPGVYRFPHRSYQEYLAGLFLTQQEDFPDQAARLARENYAQWREAILWAVGAVARLNNQTFLAVNVADALCPRQTPGPNALDTEWRLAHLAGEALLETGLEKVQPHERHREVLDRVRRCLAALLEAGALSPRERAAAGDTLARLGDPRPGVTGVLRTPERTAVPDMEFCLVPGGPFWMGGGDKEHLNERLTYDYWMGRWPVTVAQFRCFVDDPAGYRHDAWWTAAGLKWRGERADPTEPGEPFNLPNHPVVRVTWYEALAFTRWLTARWAAPAVGILPAGWEVRLPSEAEWEKAARGGVEIPAEPVIARVGESFPCGVPPGGARKENPKTRRRYPWGDDADPTRANYDETEIGATSAVGCFPHGASPCGCEDMSGNVWEWCATKWQESYTDYRDDNDPEGDVPRVMRGGSFSYDVVSVRCSLRDWLDPDVFVVSGFRVVVAPRDSGL